MPSGKQQPTSTTQTVQNYSPQEAARRDTLQAAAEQLYVANKDKIANTPYPGPEVVPFDPATLSGRALARDYAGGAGADMFGNITNAQKFSLHDVLYPESNPALAASVQGAINPVLRAFSDAGGPMATIRAMGRDEGGGGAGTRSDIATGIAADRLQQNIGDITSRMYSDAYGKGLDTMMRSLALAPQTYGLGFTPANIESSIGTQEEARTQDVADRESAAKMWEMNAPWLPLQNWANIVYGGSTPGTTSTTIGSIPKRSPIVGAAGGALSGGALGSSIGLASGGTLAIPGAILGGLLGLFG